MDSEESSLTCSKPQSKPTGSMCKICDSPASHSYFGAIACSACKMFFRRNAEKDLVCCYLSLRKNRSQGLSFTSTRNNLNVFMMVNAK